MKIKVYKCTCSSRKVMENLGGTNGKPWLGYHEPHCAIIEQLTIDLDELIHEVRRDASINLSEASMKLKLLAYALSEHR